MVNSVFANFSEKTFVKKTSFSKFLKDSYFLLVDSEDIIFWPVFKHLGTFSKKCSFVNLHLIRLRLC